MSTETGGAGPPAEAGPDSAGAPAAPGPKPRRTARLIAIFIAIAVIIAALDVVAYYAFIRDKPSPGVTELETTDVVAGTGAEAKEGDQLSVEYSVWLYEDWSKDGGPIDSGPYVFTLGAGEVIQGWEQGIPGMRVGGKRVLLIPPDLAYGNREYREIPANSSLACEVELLAIL